MQETYRTQVLLDHWRLEDNHLQGASYASSSSSFPLDFY